MTRPHGSISREGTNAPNQVAGGAGLVRVLHGRREQRGSELVDNRSVEAVADGAWPVVVWWWDRAGDRDVPPAHAIRWVELDGLEERRSGTAHVSKRTSDPADPDDAAIRTELHHQLERRLGTPIRVDHALRHLDQMNVGRRLAVRGHRVTTLKLGEYDLDLLGGVAVQVAGHRWRGEVVVRADLTANARDQLLVWAEHTLDSIGPRPVNLDELGWTPTQSGGWQQLLHTTRDATTAT